MNLDKLSEKGCHSKDYKHDASSTKVMDPILFTSVNEYNKANPLPWLIEHNKKNKTAMLKIIKSGIKEELSYTKIASNLNTEFPELKVKSKCHHATYISTEIVLTEMRIRSEIKKYEDALIQKSHGWELKKKWNSMPDSNICNICKENCAVGWIPLIDSFPSEHIYAPGHMACRCNVTYMVEKRSSPDSGLPKDRWIVKQEGNEVKIISRY